MDWMDQLGTTEPLCICIFATNLRWYQQPLPDTTPLSRLAFPRVLKRVHCLLLDWLGCSFTCKDARMQGCKDQDDDKLKIKDPYWLLNEGHITCNSVTSTITGWPIRGEIFTQLTKRQSGFSLHLCQQAARLRAFVRRPRTLCPLRLVLFLKSFLHPAQERTTLDWQDWLKKKNVTGYVTL